jgi:hypothetical protein
VINVSSLAMRWLFDDGRGGVDNDAGVRRSVGGRLAGLVLRGDPPTAARAALRRAAAREAADYEVARAATGNALGWLAAEGVTPLVWKGLALAAAWPDPSLRPAGDLDLLVEAALLEPTARAFESRGWQRASYPSQFGLLSRFRPEAPGIELWPPTGQRLPIDISVRPFRTVGAAFDGASLLQRSHAGQIDGHTVRLLDPPDELALVLVHAAKHGVRAPRWLIDGVVLARRGAIELAAERASDAGARRAFAASLRLVAELDDMALSPLQRFLGTLWSPLFRLDAARDGIPLSSGERYALELCLEPSLSARARAGLGVLGRLTGW